MSRRSVIGLVYMLQGISLLGVDPTPVLARYGISLETLDPAAEIERDQEMAILQEVAALIDNPLAGLSIGESISTAGYGALTMLLMTCDNTLDAMQAGVHYQQLTYLHGSLHLEEEGDFIALVICPLPMQEGVRRILIDGDLTYYIEGKAYILKPWDILFVNKNEIHKPVVNPNKYYERIVIWLNPDFMAKYAQGNNDLLKCFEVAIKNNYNLLRLNMKSIEVIKNLIQDIQN